MGRWSIFNNHVQYRRRDGKYSTTMYSTDGMMVNIQQPCRVPMERWTGKMVDIQQPCTVQMGRWSIFNNHVQYRWEDGQYSTTKYSTDGKMVNIQQLCTVQMGILTIFPSVLYIVVEY